MRSSDPKELIDDILLEGDYRKFRARLLKEASQEFRAAHPQKQDFWFWRLAAALAILLCICAALLVRRSQPDSIAKVEIKPLPLEAPNHIKTDSLRKEQVVTTKPFASVITTQPLVDSESQLVSTPANATVPTLNDSELLALFPARPILFAKISGGQKTLVLVDDINEESTP